MNTAENNDNYFQNSIIFLTHLTLGSSSNRRDKYDISLKKKRKKNTGGEKKKESLIFSFFVCQSLQLMNY